MVRFRIVIIVVVIVVIISGQRAVTVVLRTVDVTGDEFVVTRYVFDGRIVSPDPVAC